MKKLPDDHPFSVKNLKAMTLPDEFERLLKAHDAWDFSNPDAKELAELCFYAGAGIMLAVVHLGVDQMRPDELTEIIKRLKGDLEKYYDANNPPEPVPGDWKCPECGMEFKTSIMPKPPVVGDLSFCGRCGKPMQFTKVGLKMLTAAEIEALEPEAKNSIEMARHLKERIKDSAKHGPAYLDMVNTLRERADQWRRDNPTREALIQFNYPKEVMMIQPLSIALKMGTVTANDAGHELIKAIWSGEPSNTEPTVFMLRLAIETTTHIERTEL